MASRSLRCWIFCLCVVAGISAAGSLVVSSAATAEAQTSTSARVVQLQINSEIEPILAEYIINGIAQAGREHASLVLITINTPGGLDTSMREIIHAILSSPVPVVTYVNPTGSRAASAGFFILLSGDIAAMSPGTDTGAASPIMELGGSPVQIDDTLRKKILNEATAYLRSYVSQRGRNADLAATAVTDAKAFSEKEAIDGHLVDLLASSPADLLAQLNGRQIKRFDGSTVQLTLTNLSVEEVGMTSREKFLSRIVDPDVFFILLIVGILGLYAEFTHPGLFAPGVIGGISIVLALFSMHLLPVNITGLVLIGLALALFVLEAKYPTHGILGVGGVISMILGALMLIRSPLTGGGVSIATALGVAIPFAVIIIILMRFVLRSRSWKLATGKEELIGTEGEITEAVGGAAPSVSESSVAPDSSVAAGMIRLHGELWRAVTSNGEAIPKGARARVKQIQGLTLIVEPVTPQHAVRS